MNNSFNRQHAAKTTRSKHEVRAPAQRDKSPSADNKKPRADDPVNSEETRRRNQKGYS